MLRADTRGEPLLARTLRSAAKYAQCDTRIANATLRKLRYFAGQLVFTGASVSVLLRQYQPNLSNFDLRSGEITR